MQSKPGLIVIWLQWACKSEGILFYHFKLSTYQHEYLAETLGDMRMHIPLFYRFCPNMEY